MIALPDEYPPQRHIEIIDPNSGNRVVTAIELLSPANKCTRADRRAYREKQREYIQGGVNLVEIDLIREGSFIVAIPEGLVPRECRAPYIICVRRAAAHGGRADSRAATRAAAQPPRPPAPQRSRAASAGAGGMLSPRPIPRLHPPSQPTTPWRGSTLGGGTIARSREGGRVLSSPSSHKANRPPRA